MQLGSRGVARVNDSSIEDDHLFHLKIAECSKNQVLRSLIGLLTPGVIAYSYENDTCRDGRAHRALQEHEAILEAIEQRDPDKAAEAMTMHMEQSRKQFVRP